MLDSDIFNKKKHKYNCSFCGYNCDTKFLFKQHCSTKKHIKNEAANIVIKKNRNFFLKNPRLSMMVRIFDKMKPERKKIILKEADNFIKKNTA